MDYGLIGERLSHSFSREIHRRIAPYSYELHELPPDDLGSFLQNRGFRGVNVTIPYKQAVLPYLDGCSESARETGAVNTIVRRGGRLFGDNTDWRGMTALVQRLGLDFAGRRVLILGTGGTSHTAQYAAKRLGAASIRTVSRTGRGGALTYAEAADVCRDTQILINTTPAGMFPQPDAQAISLDPFRALEGVLDVVYNPLRTQLVLDAQARGIPAEGGLYMLVGQAVAAAECFLAEALPPETADRVFGSILAEKENFVLIGMPGSGKSTVGRRLAEALHRPFYDTDSVIEARAGASVPRIFAAEGEAFFRKLEADVIAELAQKTGCVIATGGGAVLSERNVRRLRANGCLCFLDRPLSEITPTDDRPLSRSREALAALYRERAPLYRAAADQSIPVTGTPDDAVRIILDRPSGRP